MNDNFFNITVFILYYKYLFRLFLVYYIFVASSRKKSCNKTKKNIYTFLGRIDTESKQKTKESLMEVTALTWESSKKYWCDPGILCLGKRSLS